ncbi:putative SLC9B1-like protein SLC9B1P1 [Venturia canescens]|uniref:putative SLC9B1-like protein SLC9B1P1 n=1 Tax=Venturia canescens TaxID=32260 RepID=UPI001C9C79FC|nr:putative SLC9B1-like protein SLC9B1P1 [Venturia canescens]
MSEEIDRSIIACMSPVVTVNCMLALADRGYGEDKGMATLLCTASSIDDVHIVSLYSICFSVVFSVDSKSTAWWTYIPGGLRDLLLGVVTGTLLGLLFVFFPHRAAKYVSLYRLASLILGALMCTTAASTIAITGGGYLATIVMAFIATTGWRVIDVNFDVTSMRRVIFFAWHFMQPVLVGVIGADINFANWSWNKFGLYVVCILVGLLARSAVCIMSTYRTNFNTKERVFVALAWLSKGTLQAALAPMTYENAKLENDPVKVEIALDVMRISVVSIIFLAPLGAVIMMVSGPLLLNRTAEEETTRERHLSHLRKTNQLQPILSRQGNEKGRRGRSEAS